MRYRAMVITGKRTWGSPLSISSKMFGIWDYSTADWWKGYSDGRVTYKHYESAAQRAKELNEGTYVSNYMGPRDTEPQLYARLIAPDGGPGSHWFKLPTRIVLYHEPPYPYRPKEFRFKDDGYEYIRDFYRVEESKWKMVDGEWTRAGYEVSLKDDWSIEWKVSHVSDKEEKVLVSGQEYLSIWLTEREALHEFLKEKRDTMMTDITDRSGCYGTHWQPEPDKEADRWEYDVMKDYGGDG